MSYEIAQQRIATARRTNSPHLNLFAPKLTKPAMLLLLQFPMLIVTVFAVLPSMVTKTSTEPRPRSDSGSLTFS